MRGNLAWGAGIAFAMGAMTSSLALAQAYPAKPVRVVVPAAPGGGQDLVIRLVAPGMGADLGQSVVVENRAGANGIVGADHVAHAAADGYTYMFTGPSTLAAPMFARGVPYKAEDFAAVSLAVEPVSVVVVNAALPVSSLAELIDYSKRNPGKLSYGSSGIASSIHLMAELLKGQSGLDMTHVPYKGVGPAMADLAAGHIMVSIASAASALPFSRSGKMRILAVTLDRRYALMPSVPTVSESVPAFRKPPTWFAMLAPAAVPRAALVRFHASLAKALSAPELKPRFDEEGLLVVGNTPDEFAAGLKLDMQVHQRAMDAAGLKPE